MNSFIPSTKPYISSERQRKLHDRFDQILNGWLSQGPLVEEFERSFAEYVGTRYAVAMSSGSCALYVALRYFDLKGGEVILPTMTCFSCASAVILAGGFPRLANVEPDTLCLDLEDTIRQIGPKTRGIMVVHLAGQIVPWIDELRNICTERGLFLLEDAAHATGASVNGCRAGSLADVGCFSFHTTKIMTTGEGGMITTSEASIADFCRRFREIGVSKDKLNNDIFALNLRMDELSAALGIEQLAELDSFVRRRNEIVENYRALLVEVPEVQLLPLRNGRISSYWKVYARMAQWMNRDTLTKRMLNEFQVDVRPAYRPLLHEQPVLGSYVENRSRFLLSDHAMAHLLCLPIFLTITQAQMEYVVEGLKKCIRNFWEGRK